MRKLKLDLEELRVDTFSPAGGEEREGTVFGEQITAGTCLNTCQLSCVASCIVSCNISCVRTCFQVTCAGTCNRTCIAILCEPVGTAFCEIETIGPGPVGPIG